MMADFGSSAARRRTRRGPDLAPRVVEALLWLSWLAATSAVPASVAFATWADVEARKAEWTIVGPPCPTVTRLAASVVGLKGPRRFEYGGADFSHAFGEASCAAIGEDGLLTRETYPVCQFNNPGAVTVSAHGRSVIFQPPVGDHATVTVRRGVARCVVGGWFTY